MLITFYKFTVKCLCWQAQPSAPQGHCHAPAAIDAAPIGVAASARAALHGAWVVAWLAGVVAWLAAWAEGAAYWRGRVLAGVVAAHAAQGLVVRGAALPVACLLAVLAAVAAVAAASGSRSSRQ